MKFKVSIGILSALFLWASLCYELGCGGDTRTRGTASDGAGDAMVAGNSSSEEAVSPCAPLVSSSSLTAYAGKVTALNFSGGSVTVDGVENGVEEEITVSANDVTGVQLVNPITSEAWDVPIVGKNLDGSKLVAKVPPTSGLLSDQDYQVKVLTGISACSTINLNDRLSMIDRPSLITIASEGTQTVSSVGPLLDIFELEDGISLVAGTTGFKKINEARIVISTFKVPAGTGVGGGNTINPFTFTSPSSIDVIAFSPPTGESEATRSMYIVDGDGELLATVDSELPALQAIAISPDGTRLLFGLLCSVKMLDISAVLENDSGDPLSLSGDDATAVSVSNNCGALKKIRWLPADSRNFVLVHENRIFKRDIEGSTSLNYTTTDTLVDVVLPRSAESEEFVAVTSLGKVKRIRSADLTDISEIDCALTGVSDSVISHDDGTVHVINDSGDTDCSVNLSNETSTKMSLTLTGAIKRTTITGESLWGVNPDEGNTLMKIYGQGQ
ncbi:MAG: hypothetical protein HY538_04375 [Deltaproteobacteria bacterium]|nr:hypothetical protein [Deltaproteobacteria bacterium]